MATKARPKKYKLRKARATDAFVLLEMMKEFLAEISSHYPAVDDMDCLNWMLGVISMGGAWVAIADRRIVGSIGCNVDRFPWNKKYAHVFDEWFYVRPQFRSGYDIAKQLIELAKEAAVQAGLPFIFSVNSGKDIRIDTFVERQGFQYKGGILIYWPPGTGNDGQEGRQQSEQQQS